MPLNTTGAISLGGSTAGQSINLELGQAATAQVSLGDANVRTLAGVASGAIVVPTNFYGKSSVIVNFVDVIVTNSQSTVTSSAYRVNTDGFDYRGDGGTFTSLAQWVTPASIGNGYEVFATIVNGSVSSGTVGSWVATSGSPTWTRNVITVGTTQTVNLSMQVRAVGTSTVLDTWAVRLEASRF